MSANHLTDNDKVAVLNELAEHGYVMCPKWVADTARINPGASLDIGTNDVTWISRDAMEALDTLVATIRDAFQVYDDRLQKVAEEARSVGSPQNGKEQK